MRHSAADAPGLVCDCCGIAIDCETEDYIQVLHASNPHAYFHFVRGALEQQLHQRGPLTTAALSFAGFMWQPRLRWRQIPHQARNNSDVGQPLFVLCRNAPTLSPRQQAMPSRQTAHSRDTFAAQLCDQATASLGQNLLQLERDGYPSGAALAPLPASELRFGADIELQFFNGLFPVAQDLMSSVLS